MTMPHSQKAADQAVDWSLEKGEMTMPRIIPIRDLKDTTAISQMCKESREPVFITKNGYGDMVIMSMEAYEERMLLLDAVVSEAEGKAWIIVLKSPHPPNRIWMRF